MVDDQELEQVNQYCDSTIDLIKQNEMKKAFDVWDEFLNGDVYPYPSFYKNVTESNDYDNVCEQTRLKVLGILQLISIKQMFDKKYTWAMPSSIMVMNVKCICSQISMSALPMR